LKDGGTVLAGAGYSHIQRFRVPAAYRRADNIAFIQRKSSID